MVFDGSNDFRLPDVSLRVGSAEAPTNENGEVYFKFQEGNYSYSALREDYTSVIDSLALISDTLISIYAVDDIPVASTTTTCHVDDRGAARHDGSGGARPDARPDSARSTRRRPATHSARRPTAPATTAHPTAPPTTVPPTTAPPAARRPARGRVQSRRPRAVRDSADRVGFPAGRARRLGDARCCRGTPGPRLPGRRAAESPDEDVRADDAGAAATTARSGRSWWSISARTADSARRPSTRCWRRSPTSRSCCC